MYIDSDALVNGDGSESNPYNDLFYAMNILSVANTVIYSDVRIIMNSNADRQYNMFDPSKSPLLYSIDSAISLSLEINNSATTHP